MVELAASGLEPTLPKQVLGETEGLLDEVRSSPASAGMTRVETSAPPHLDMVPAKREKSEAP
jgi:hypothetical protein